MFTPLTQLGLKYDTDKAYFHSFTEFYYDTFSILQDKEINILEIGILSGASLKMLADFFPRATIYAIDNNEKTVNAYYGDRIKTYLCNQIDFITFDRLFKDMRFDLIIDDGSHITSHQQQTLGYLFNNYLTSGGIYVCEDIHTSLWDRYVDTKQTTLDLFEKFNVDKVFKCNLLTNEQNAYLTQHIQSILIYKRTVNAYKCYKCKQVNTNNNSTCTCGTALDPRQNPSYTSIIYK